MTKQWLRQEFPPTFFGAIQALTFLLVMYVWVRLAQYVTGSFGWPMDGDLSFLYYIAWLMNEHDYVPYRDVHETSFFGTFIFYSNLTRLIGYSTTAFHWADLFFFSLLSGITFWLLKPFGKLCALLAIGLFGEFYFKMGFGVHLQRDFIALLPAAVAILILHQQKFSLLARSAIVGILFGIASCIKPQFAGGILIALGYLIVTERKANDSIAIQFVKISFGAFAGFVCVWTAGFIWLTAHGIENEFMDMAIHYLPAYSSINGRNFARESVDAWTGAGKWLFGMIFTWAIPVVISVYRVIRSNKVTMDKKDYGVIAVILYWMLYLAYVPMAGKYWGYHILPSYYFLAILLSFIATSKYISQNKITVSIMMLSWTFFYFFMVAEDNVRTRNHQLIESNEQSRLTTISLEDFLRDSLKEGDKVQAHVSHTRGPVFPALLSAKAIPATPYLENYLLYHDVDSPFVRNARTRFLSALEKNPPRFIIYTPTMFGFRGPGTENMFMPFEKWMNAHYKRVLASQDDISAAFDRVEIYEYQMDR